VPTLLDKDHDIPSRRNLAKNGTPIARGYPDAPFIDRPHIWTRQDQGPFKSDLSRLSMSSMVYEMLARSYMERSGCRTAPDSSHGCVTNLATCKRELTNSDFAGTTGDNKTKIANTSHSTRTVKGYACSMQRCLDEHDTFWYAQQMSKINIPANCSHVQTRTGHSS
jgi:hypothetical protein